jgi:hypothetical protein
VIVGIAGQAFAIEPEAALSIEERSMLARFGSAEKTSTFRLSIADTPPFAANDAPADGEPAQIATYGDRIRITHHRFVAELDPQSSRGVLHRANPADAFALEITLRTALSCRLPCDGGLLLHTAGAVIDGNAVLFFGVSGAGKSTLAELLPAPILSDELVAVSKSADRFHACATGFWGTLEGLAAAPPSGSFPIQALVALDRGDDFAIEAIDRRDALRSLIVVAVVPPDPPLWRAALGVVASLAATVPVYRLAWTPSAANAERIVAHFRR